MHRALLFAFLKIDHSQSYYCMIAVLRTKPLWQSINQSWQWIFYDSRWWSTGLPGVRLSWKRWCKDYPVSGEPHFSAMSALQFCRVSSVSGGRWKRLNLMKMKILKLMRRVSGVRWKRLKLMNGNNNRINVQLHQQQPDRNNNFYFFSWSGRWLPLLRW